MNDTIRVYRLAHALGVEPARILALCRENGMDVRNSVSSLTPAQRKTIVRLLRREGPDGDAGQPAPVRHPPPSGHGRCEI
jgi:hypothetical protein